MSNRQPESPNQLIDDVLMLGMGWFPDQPGGLNRYFRELHRALAASGPSPQAVVVGPASDATTTVAVPASGGDSLPRRLWRYARAARSRLQNPVVVDAHFALYAAPLVLAAGLKRNPLVLHFQGPWAEESRANGQSRGLIFAKRLLERAVYRRAREVIVLSQAFKRILVERYAIPPWMIHVIPPGVDLARFNPGCRTESRDLLGLPAHAFVALSVRRLVPRMGVDVLLNAWECLCRATERDDLVLVVVGDGAIRERLEAQAADLGIARNVRFAGRAGDDQLPHYYRAADLCVVPSTELEGFGLVVLESLACGTPVVATAVGGLPEVLRPLQRDLIVPANDAEALASRLGDALERPESLPPASRCRAYAEAFSWPTVATHTRAVYQRALRPPERRRPRVVYVDHCARLSGGELALLKLLPALTAVEKHVVLGEEGPLVSRLLEAGISSEVLPLSEHVRNLRRDRVRATGFPLFAGLASAAYVLRLARRLRQLRPDLVHTNSLKAAIYGGLAARLAGIPVVWHIRDRIATDYLPPAAVRMARWLARHVCDSLIANSRATLACLDVAGARAIPSPGLLDTARFATRKTAHSSPAPFTVGMAGRLAPWKGQHVFIEAFARAFPNGAERAVIIGAALFGEETYARELEAHVQSLGLSGRVEFPGFCEDIATQLGRLDTLVHASIVAEPFGQVVVEGMAAGLPVVATAAGGPSEVIEDGVTGLLYPPGDVQALAGLLRKLAEDRELRDRIGDAARRQAQQFSPEVIAAQVLEVYQSLLARDGADRLWLCGASP